MFNRENPQNSEPQNGPRSGLDYIALRETDGTRVEIDVANSLLDSISYVTPYTLCNTFSPII